MAIIVTTVMLLAIALMTVGDVTTHMDKFSESQERQMTGTAEASVSATAIAYCNAQKQAGLHQCMKAWFDLNADKIHQSPEEDCNTIIDNC